MKIRNIVFRLIHETNEHKRMKNRQTTLFELWQSKTARFFRIYVSKILESMHAFPRDRKPQIRNRLPTTCCDIPYCERESTRQTEKSSRKMVYEHPVCMTDGRKRQGHGRETRRLHWGRSLPSPLISNIANASFRSAISSSDKSRSAMVVSLSKKSVCVPIAQI